MTQPSSQALSDHAGQGERFLTLDGLRGIAAVMVLIAHTLQVRDDTSIQFHGYLAVDFFFMLSGFVIAYAYGGRLAGRRMSFAEFLKARILRLYPLIVVGAILGFAAISLKAHQLHWTGLMLRAVATLPFSLMALPAPFLEHQFDPNAPVWSLFYELLANIVLALFAPRLSNRNLLVAIVASGLVLVAAGIVTGEITFGLSYSPISPRLSDALRVFLSKEARDLPLGLVRVAFPFLCGIGLYRAHAARRFIVPALPVWLLAPILVALLAVPAIPDYRDVTYCLFAIIIAFPLIIASAARCEPNARLRHLTRLSGELSYPIYIVHMPILNLFALLPIGGLSLAFRINLAAVTAIIFAWLVLRYYDEPLRRAVRNRWRSPSTPEFAKSLSGKTGGS